MKMKEIVDIEKLVDSVCEKRGIDIHYENSSKASFVEEKIVYRIDYPDEIRNDNVLMRAYTLLFKLRAKSDSLFEVSSIDDYRKIIRLEKLIEDRLERLKKKYNVKPKEIKYLHVKTSYLRALAKNLVEEVLADIA